MATPTPRTPALIDRRARVRALADAGTALPVIAETLAREGMTNPKTGKPYSETTLRRDLGTEPFTRGTGAGAVVQEIIGRQWYLSQYWQATRYPFTVDAYRTDYALYDRLRTGKAIGYEISGLYCQAITDTLASYVMGDAPTYTLADGADNSEPDDPKNYTDARLADFMATNHARLTAMVSDMYALGDQFVVVNPNGSLSIPSPDTAIVTWDPFEFRRMLEVKFLSRWNGYNVEDTYTASHRILRYRRGGELVKEVVYDNLIGRLPVVLLANNRHQNEQFGRPVYEALLPLLGMYNDLHFKAYDGVRIMGNPIPVFEGMENLQQTIEANQAPFNEVYPNPNGGTSEQPLVNFNTNAVVWVGKGGTFKFAAPQVGFSEDMRRVLDSLFLLICKHMRMPEFLWGGAVEASKASTESQMPPFEQYIKFLRVKLDGERVSPQQSNAIMGGMYELITLWLMTMRLTDPNIVVAPVRSSWSPIGIEQDNVRLQKTIYADSKGYVTPETTLESMNLVPDARKEVRRAREAMDAQRDLDAEFMTAVNAAAHQQVDAEKRGLNPNDPRKKNPVLPKNPGGGKPFKPAVSESVAGALTTLDAALPAGLDGTRLTLNGSGVTDLASEEDDALLIAARKALA